MFVEFKKHVELLCNRKIRALQTDNGDEFLALKSFLSDHGIAHWRSYPYIHQQMGSVEQWHRHIVDIGLSLLDHAKLPLEFWYFTFTAAAFLYSRVASPSLFGESPYRRLFGQPPNLIGLKTFGCQVYPNMRPNRCHKFSPCSDSHVFLGYPCKYLGYICFNPLNGRVIVSKDVVFLEDDFD